MKVFEVTTEHCEDDAISVIEGDMDIDKLERRL